MTLDEAIEHAEEVAEEKEQEGKLLCDSELGSIGCLKCAEEYNQLAEWLRDYKRLKEEAEPCEDAVSRKDVIKAVDRHTFDTDDGLCLDEDISIILGGLPPVKPTQNWIPVSEGLPENETRVLTTIKIPNRIARVRSGWYDSGFIHNDNGGFFHNDNGDVWKATDMEVIAWLPLPEPYKAVKKCCSDCKHHTDGEEIHGVTPCGSCGAYLRNFLEK